MAKGNDVSTTIVLEGEKQYRDAIKGINQSLKVNQTETEKLIALYAKESGSVQALTAKQESLVSTISEQKNKVSTLAGAVDLAAQKYGEADKRTQNWQIELNKAQAELYKLENALDETNASLDRASAGSAEYEAALDGINQEMSGMSAVAQKAFDSFIEGAKEGQLSLGGVWDSIKEGMASTGAAADGMGGLIAGALSGGPILAAAGLTTSIAKIAMEGRQMAVEFESSSVKMQNALNLTKKEADEAAKSVKKLYKEGIVDSQEEAQEILTNVMKYLEMEGEEAQEFSNKIAAIGMDSETTIRTTRTLAEQFGLSYSEALDVIAAGITNIKAPQEEVLDTLNEYANSFSRLGYDAQGFLDTLYAGMDAGAYSVDKAADSIKEFYNKASSGDTSFAEALGQLGLNAESTMNALSAGGDRAQQAFTRVAQKLDNMNDKAKQAQISSALFGSQWEDVGSKAVLAMGNAEKGLVSYAGTADRQVQNIMNSSENLQKQAERMSEDIGKNILNIGAHIIMPGITNLIDGWDQSMKSIVQLTKSAEPDAKEAGAQMSAGVVEGWKSGDSAAYQAVKDTVNGMLNTATATALIHSPSKLFENKVGAQLAAGVDVGWDKGMEKTFRNMRHSLADDMEMLRTPPGGFGADTGRAASSSSEYVDNATYNYYYDLKIDNLETFNQVMKRVQNERMSRRQGYVKH